jgi:hypothetical protein
MNLSENRQLSGLFLRKKSIATFNAEFIQKDRWKSTEDEEGPAADTVRSLHANESLLPFTRTR